MTKLVKIGLIEGGRARWEKTNEFISKRDEIEREVKEKFTAILSNERNWIKRFLIKVKLNIEIRKRIAALSSLKNLHFGNTGW